MEKSLNNTEKTGVLNISPIKISGKYKIIVTDNYELFLDDYMGRRVKIDKSQQFLPQVSNFLSTYSHINQPLKTQYGAFNHGKQKAFHIPIYLKNDYPKYCAINRVGNKFVKIQEPLDLYRTANTIKLIDLKKIGLHKIFDEVNNTFDQMIYFNLEDKFIDVYGYSIRDISKVYKRIMINDSLANQPYFEVFNNKIMNLYKEQELFYPKFLNIEFEFNDNSKDFEVYNYFGFMCNSTEIKDEKDLNTDMINIQLYDYPNKIEYNQTGKFLQPIKYQNLLYTKTIIQTRYNEASVKYSVNNLSVGDYIEIYHPDKSLYFQYIVGEIDIKSTLRESLNVVAKRATQQSNNQFEFKVTTTYNVSTNSKTESNFMTIKILIDGDIAEEYSIKHSQVFRPVNEDRFISVGFNDVIVSGLVEADNVVINNKNYNILMKYKLDKDYYLRLDDEVIFNGKHSLIGDFYIDVYTKIIQLNNIPYLTYNDNLLALKQFDKTEYIKELKKRFVDGNNGSDDEKKQQKEASKTAIESFASRKNFVDILPYIKDVLVEKSEIENTYKSEETDVIKSNKSDNFDLVKNMMFESVGTTSFITPNILNIDKQFWGSNGNIEYRKTEFDDLRYHWFLIKSETPKYAQNDVRSLRYFTDEPKIKSKIYLSGNNAETIFLGVKYLMNRKYKNYEFCVYLNADNDLYMDAVYHVEIRNKTIYVIINKYLDFVDLIRGGDSLNKPFIDLSFFYCVDEPHNSLSNNLLSFKTGGVLLCDTKISVNFENISTKDWKHFHNGKWYVCLKRSNSVITDKFTDLFPSEKDVDFYVYSSVNIQGINYNYLSIKIRLKSVFLLTEDYVWCEDIEFKFFDVKRLVLNTVNPPEYFKVDFDDIITIKSNPKLPSKPYQHYNGTIDVLINNGSKQTYKILNIEDSFSLKQYYFEVEQTKEFIANKTVVKNKFFTFPEYVSSGLTFEKICETFDIQWDMSTPYEMFNIFDRNQLWLLMRTFMEVNVNFKHTTSAQTRKLLNDLLLNNLVTHTDLRSLELKNGNEYDDKFFDLTIVESDNNVAIWGVYSDIGSNKIEHKLSKLNRIRSFYNPHLRALKDELEFQNELQEIDKPLITSFDRVNNKNFKILQQVEGNVVSSIFAKTDDFQISTEKTNNNTYNIMTLLMGYIDINQMMLNNDSRSIDLSVESTNNYQIKYDYIYELLDKFYYVDLVYNNLNLSIKFNIDDEFIMTTESNDNLILGDNPKILINFKRKE